MTQLRSHQWEFRRRFRARAFGWRSKPAITRIREAVSEIKRVARKEPEVAAEGAVLLLERLSTALELVDSSSGAIGTAVNRAIAALVPIIAAAPATREQRDAWLERLWQAYEEDEIPYIEALGDRWGSCARRRRSPPSGPTGSCLVAGRCGRRRRLPAPSSTVRPTA